MGKGKVPLCGDPAVFLLAGTSSAEGIRIRHRRQQDPQRLRGGGSRRKRRWRPRLRELKKVGRRQQEEARKLKGGRSDKQK